MMKGRTMGKEEKQEYVESREIGESGEYKEEICEISEEHILEIFANSEYSYLLEDVIKRLSEMGYNSPGASILYAIQDGILCIDDIEDNGSVYLAVVEDDEDEVEEGKLEYM